MFKIGDKVISDKLVGSYGSIHSQTFWQPNVAGTIIEINDDYRTLKFKGDESSIYPMSEFGILTGDPINNYLQAGPIFKVGDYVVFKKDIEPFFPSVRLVREGKIHEIIKLGKTGVYLDTNSLGEVDISDLILYNMAESERVEYEKMQNDKLDILKKLNNFKVPLYQDVPVIVDKLQEILDKQSSLQDKLNKNPKHMSFMDRVRYIQDNMTHVNIEFAELLRHLPFKYWKRYTQEQLNGSEYQKNRKEVVMEYIDMICFFLNMGLALDITADELYNTYIEKYNINLKRQEEKY